MNYWKPVAIISLCAAAGLAWLQYSAMQVGSAGTQAVEQMAGNSTPAGQSAQSGGKKPIGQKSTGQNRSGRGGGRPPPLVVAQPVTDALINDRLRAVGSGTAKASVSVVPLSGGVLEEILVSSGEFVEKGEVLARLDAEEQQIARDRAARSADNAAVEEARLAKLFRTQTATEADLIRARAALADASLALRDAELKLARREITAPIAGVVGLITVDAGNYISAQTEIFTIDDRSTIVLEFWVPERFADQVAIGAAIEATAQASPGTLISGVITGVGSRVEADSRTLPVQAELDNSADTLRPGMAFNITLRFSGQSYPAVDPLAIQWDSSGSYVWVLEESTVKRVAVQIIQRNPESVLIAAPLDVGSKVVTEGLLSLRPGATVREQASSRSQSDKQSTAVSGRNPQAQGQNEGRADGAQTRKAADGQKS